MRIKAADRPRGGTGNPAEGGKGDRLWLHSEVPHEWGCRLNHRQGGRHVRRSNVWPVLETDESGDKRLD